MEELKQTTINFKNNYFTLKHILFYLLLTPAIISNYLIFNLVLNNSENLNILFNVKQLIDLLIFFSISLAFAGVTLYFLKRTYEILAVSTLLTLPIFLVNLNLDQTIIAIFASFITFFASGLLIKSKKQKYIIPNLKEQITYSFKITTLLLNFALTFIFFTQVSFITFETWVGNINNVLTPITNAVTKEVEKSLFPQKMIIGQAQNFVNTNLMELDLNKLGKTISINELDGIKNSKTLSFEEILAKPSPTDIIKNQLKTSLEPYKQFLPMIAALLAFINYQLIINVSIILSSILIIIIEFLLKLSKVITIKKELKEILTYEI